MHRLLSLQTLGVPPHVPALQASLTVHALPSLQVVPVAALAKPQAPLTGSQVSMVQGLLSVQLTTLPTHVPLWQASGLVQGLPSSQVVPLGAVPCEQAPVVGLQVSVVQALLSLQSMFLLAHTSAQVVERAPGKHTPPLQLSPMVHTLPSLHSVPAVALLCLQPLVGSQLSLVQGLLSSQ